MFMGVSPVFHVLSSSFLIFSVYGEIRVSSAYAKKTLGSPPAELDGPRAAEAVMSQAGLPNVTNRGTDGHLTTTTIL